MKMPYKLITCLTFLYFLFGTIGVANASHFDIIAFGDSITLGLKRACDTCSFYYTNGYSTFLENEFLNKTRHSSTVYNHGLGGESSSEGVNRISSVLASVASDYILIMLGANDPYHGISTGTTKANISIMIDKSRNEDTTPIIATITPNSTPFGDGVVSRNTGIKELVHEKEVLLADQYYALINNWSGYHSGDGLHLNNSGDARVAETWMNILLNERRISGINSIVPFISPLLLNR